MLYTSGLGHRAISLTAAVAHFLQQRCINLLFGLDDEHAAEAWEEARPYRFKKPRQP